MSIEMYNSNEKLLGTNKEYGYTLSHNNDINETSGTFVIREGAVRVPADIIFAMMQRVYAKQVRQP
jgi:hypothetical protein